MKLYQIRDTATGLFSRGGQSAFYSKWAWTKSGKVWRQLGHVKLHLGMIRESNDRIPKTWEVVEHDTETAVTRVIPVTEVAP